MSEPDPDDYLDLDDAIKNADFSEHSDNWDVVPQPEEQKGNAPIGGAIAEDRASPPACSGGASGAANRANSDTSSVFTPKRQMSAWSASKNRSATK
jgi:hypothetical protein